MTNSLQSLFGAIARTQDEQELRSQVLRQAGQYFAAKRWGLFFFSQDCRLPKALQLSLSIEYNPVLSYLVEHHTPVHEALIVSPKTWQMLCPRADHRHVMAGPLVNQSQLVGVVGFTREQGKSAFNTQDLLDLSALCLHLSDWVKTRKPFMTDSLTSREQQIAQLVAKGRTNAEIGAELWITENTVKQALKRMFRKLEVSSRAEMVAQLYG